MANPHRGEVTLTFAGRAYTLRPTFHIIATLEQRLGLTLPQLLRRVEEKGLLTTELLMIIAIATAHDGSPPFDTEAALEQPADQISLPRLLRAVSQFLLQALGGEPALHLPQLLENSFRQLGIRPAEFWQMTMKELRLLMPQAAPRIPAADPAELAGLMARFPDQTIVA